MLDIKFVRENPEIVKQNIRNKFQDNKLELVDKVIELDKENREIKQEVEALRAERNKTSKQIGALMADASAGRLAALQSHRAALLCRRAQLDALLATLDMGGYGCFTATCAVLPEYMSAIYRLWKEGDHERALFLQKKMVPVARAMMQAMPFPAGFKLALEVRGYAMGAPKLPLGAGETAGREEAAARLKGMIDGLLALL